MTPVTFFMSDTSAVAQAETLIPDRDWQHFGSGISCWITQTYLRLRDSGAAVSLSSRAPSAGIVVLHADDLHSYFRTPGFSDQCLVVCVRADRHPQRYADFEIVQNAASADGQRVFNLPHWPQPGLVPRDPERGARIENLSFKGAAAECHPMFDSADWARFIESQKFNWLADRAIWKGPKPRAYDETRWNDYTDTDVLIAIRPDTSRLHLNKPASKLVNAWLAGVPAILGPEIAYRELRRSPLDYIEASTLEEVVAALTSLHNDPQRFSAMVQNGLERGQAFHSELIINDWRALLLKTIDSRYHALAWVLLRQCSVGFRYYIRQARRGVPRAP